MIIKKSQFFKRSAFSGGNDVIKKFKVFQFGFTQFFLSLPQLVTLHWDDWCSAEEVREEGRKPTIWENLFSEEGRREKISSPQMEKMVSAWSRRLCRTFVQTNKVSLSPDQPIFPFPFSPERKKNWKLIQGLGFSELLPGGGGRGGGRSLGSESTAFVFLHKWIFPSSP